MNENSYMEQNVTELKDVLSPNVIELHLKGKTKLEIIEELLDILVKAEKIKDKKVALACVMDREKKLSTGITNGIALPHGKTDCVSGLVACIGISDNPIEFDSLDQKPTRIFIMTLSPVMKTGVHLQFLSQVSSLLKSDSMREKCLNAKTNEELLTILMSDDE
ncbi:MAG: PTS sugar transporter subunit IIA [Treponema sp.]